MINRFIVKANYTKKEFSTMENACKCITKLEKLGYNCELLFRAMGLYSDHTYLIYTTQDKSELKKQLQAIGLLG